MFYQVCIYKKNNHTIQQQYVCNHKYNKMDQWLKPTTNFRKYVSEKNGVERSDDSYINVFYIIKMMVLVGINRLYLSPT